MNACARFAGVCRTAIHPVEHGTRVTGKLSEKKESWRAA